MRRHVIALLLVAALPAGAAEWYEHYEKGVRLIERGQAEAAKAALEAALQVRSSEGLQMPAGPQQYMDYLPHLYLAIASQMTGDVDRARKELALAETSGMAAKSEVGRPLLVAYQLLLRGDATGKYPRYAVFESKPPVLTDEEFQLLRNDVLSKCDLPLDTKLQNAPWYANYELGLRLERKGDYSRALTHFIDAVAHRPNPQKQARMYGMWLIDYYPYFHIARSHVRLENWQCGRTPSTSPSASAKSPSMRRKTTSGCRSCALPKKTSTIDPGAPHFHTWRANAWISFTTSSGASRGTS